MRAASRLWEITRAMALALIAAVAASVGTVFGLISFDRIVLGRGGQDDMDPLGFVICAFGWLVTWGAWRLVRGRPGAGPIKWLLIAIAVLLPCIWELLQAAAGIMMHA